MRSIICCIAIVTCSAMAPWAGAGALEARLFSLESTYHDGDPLEARRAMLGVAFLLENESKGELSKTDRAEYLQLAYSRLHSLCATPGGDDDEAFLYFREARYWFMRKLVERGESAIHIAERVRGFSEQSTVQFALSHAEAQDILTRANRVDRIAGESEGADWIDSYTYCFPRGDGSLGDQLNSLVPQYLEGSVEQARQATMISIELLLGDGEQNREVWESAFSTLPYLTFSRMHCIAIAEGDEVGAFLNCEEALYWKMKSRMIRCGVGEEISCTPITEFSQVAQFVRDAVSDEQWCRNSLLLDIPNRDGHLPAFADGGGRLKAPVPKPRPVQD